MKCIYFCDESGSTGSNWNDKTQPFFAMGGILIPAKNKVSLEETFRKKFIKEDEFKASSYFYEEMHYKKALDFFKEITMKYDCVPIYFVGEKKFFIAAKLIEFLFDPEYNKGVSPIITEPNEFKKALASEIMNYESIVERFSKMMNTRNFDENLLKLLTRDLKEKLGEKYPKVAKKLESLDEDSFKAMVEEYSVTTDSKRTTVKYGLHLPVAAAILQKVDIFGQVFLDTSSKIPIYFDETEYIGILQEYVDIHSEIDFTITCANDSGMYSTGFNHIDSIDSYDSKVEIGIQVADMLVGYLTKFYKKFITDKKIFQSELELHKFFVQINLYHLNNYRFMIFDDAVSHDFRNKLYSIHGSTHKVEKKDIIDKGVDKY